MNSYHIYSLVLAERADERAGSVPSHEHDAGISARMPAVEPARVSDKQSRVNGIGRLQQLFCEEGQGRPRPGICSPSAHGTR